MTKTDGNLIGGQFVLDFEHWDFGIASDFGFRYSDFMAIPAPVELPKSRTELMRQAPRSVFLTVIRVRESCGHGEP
jgi:hypothetical protein